MQSILVKDQLRQSADDAIQRNQVREELLLVSDMLKEFRSIATDKLMTEKGREGPQPISDKSRIELALAIAKTISALNVDRFKLDSAEYIHYDELLVRIPMMVKMTERMFERLQEMLVNGEKNALETIKKSWWEEFRAVWDKRSICGTRTE